MLSNFRARTKVREKSQGVFHNEEKAPNTMNDLCKVNELCKVND